MPAVFLEMLLSGSIMVVVIVVLRAVLLHKLPKRTFLLLWELSILRFLLPFSIPSATSIYTVAERWQTQHPAVVQEVTPAEKAQDVEAVPDAPAVPAPPPAPAAVPAQPSAEERPEPAETPEPAPAPEPEAEPVRISLPMLWAAGAGVSLLVFWAMYLVSLRRFRFACLVKDPGISAIIAEQGIRRRVTVRSLGGLHSPLTYGLLRPVILLPAGMDTSDPETMRLILTHECMHIRRLDCLRKVVAAVAVSLYWFDPLAWVMYLLYNRDMELACDECVVQRAPADCRKAYAMALIDMAEKQSFLTSVHSNFAQNAIEERIVAIMKHKRYGYTATAISCLLTAAIMGSLGTSAVQASIGMAETTDPDYDEIWSEPQIIITDGTELTTDILNNVPYQKKLDGDGHFFEIYSVEEMLAESGSDYIGTEPHIRELLDTKGGYGDDAKVYMVLCNSTIRNNVPALLRRIELNNDCILEAVTCTKKSGFRRNMAGSGYIYSKTTSIVSSVYQDERYVAWKAQEAQWMAECDDFLKTVDCKDLKDSAIDAMLKEQGIMTTYEMEAAAKKQLGAIIEDPVYEGKCAYAVNYSFHETDVVCGYLDAWYAVGDFDGSGVVDAADASRILTSAAKAGTGLESLTWKERSHGDVNSDGMVDASDAALILQYAASAGLNEGLTIQQFMESR